MKLAGYRSSLGLPHLQNLSRCLMTLMTLPSSIQEGGCHSDELPEPGLDGADSSTYHSTLIPPDVHEADGDESATCSHDP
eukprot:4872825-Pleurochrysis_carterae.AAC.1